MNPFIDTIDKSVSEIERIDKLFKKSKSNQIKTKDERDVLKAVAITWFHTHRVIIVKILEEVAVSQVDKYYQDILALADKSPLRQKCLTHFKKIRTELLKLRNENITKVANPTSKTVDTVPNFATVITDLEMQKIMTSRWSECINCVENNAPLAAIVMMGGLLETLLLSRINRLQNQAPVFTAKAAPKNPKTGQTLPLNEWTLKNYIEVAHELKWISQTEKDLGVDSRILWELCKTICRQIL
jgi:hypothetical protein